MWKTVIVENVVGCDVERAKAIVRTKAGITKLNFVERVKKDNRYKSQTPDEEKNFVILWILREKDGNYYVNQKVKFQVFEKDELEELSEPSDLD